MKNSNSEKIRSMFLAGIINEQEVKFLSEKPYNAGVLKEGADQDLESLQYIGKANFIPEEFRIIGALYKIPEADDDGNVYAVPEFSFFTEDIPSQKAKEIEDSAYEHNKNKTNCNHCGAGMRWFWVVEHQGGTYHFIGNDCGANLKDAHEFSEIMKGEILSKRRLAVKKAKALKFLNKDPELKAAFEVDNIIIQKIKDDLFQKGTITSKQAFFVKKLANDNPEIKRKYQEFIQQYPHVVKAIQDNQQIDIVKDMGEKLLAFGSLSEKQIDWILKITQKADASGGHVGSVGERLKKDLKCYYANKREGQFGDYFIVKFEDSESNKYTYMGNLSFIKGESYNITFTVKSHDDYQGEKSTKISRPTINN